MLGRSELNYTKENDKKGIHMEENWFYDGSESAEEDFLLESMT